jgi:hypothetical protein
MPCENYIYLEKKKRWKNCSVKKIVIGYKKLFDKLKKNYQHSFTTTSQGTMCGNCSLILAWLLGMTELSINWVHYAALCQKTPKSKCSRNNCYDVQWFYNSLGLACSMCRSRSTGRSPRPLWYISYRVGQNTLPQQISAQTDERFPSYGFSKFGSN